MIKNKRVDKDGRRRITVPFGPSEKEMIEFIDKQCDNQKLKVATYIKKLIRKAMEEPEEQDLTKLLDKYFKNKSVILENNEDKKDVSVNKKTYTKEDQNAVLKFLKSK